MEFRTHARIWDILHQLLDKQGRNGAFLQGCDAYGQTHRQGVQQETSSDIH